MTSTTTLSNIVALRDSLTKWFPTANIVQLSFGNNYLRIQILRTDGLMAKEHKVRWDDLLQADKPPERLVELLTRAGSSVNDD